MTLPITPSQTIGPFSHEAWGWAVHASDEVAGQPTTITISGIITDGAGTPIDDAMIEFTALHAVDAEQANTLPGFRRTPSGADGGYRFMLPGPAHGQPAALVTVFARGLVLHQFSAVFLEDDPALAASPVLEQVPSARRATLIARRTGDREYRWDIRMQGPSETVFFDYA